VDGAGPTGGGDSPGIGTAEAGRFAARVESAEPRSLLAASSARSTPASTILAPGYRIRSIRSIERAIGTNAPSFTSMLSRNVLTRLVASTSRAAGVLALSMS